MENLSSEHLKNLISKIFPHMETDLKLAILVDVPDNLVPDNEAWKVRRELAVGWASALDDVRKELKLVDINLIFYQNVHNNNADLPESGYFYDGPTDELTFQKLCSIGSEVEMDTVFESHQLFLAPTEFSPTAPLKLAAQKYGFRAATMPGFAPAMLPALKQDYDEIGHRVRRIKSLVDNAIGAEINFLLEADEHLQLYLDLRFREGHESGGIFPKKGMAGNLPSGECYIVPYEGEQEESNSSGFLPVQFGDEIVIYKIENNRAVFVTSSGPMSMQEEQKIIKEPAYANLAELGFGVLSDFGIKPVGEILLDEKLGLHIAFGRSDHFGGIIGVKDFSNPFAVEHLDRIYIPETQPKVHVISVVLILQDGERLILMDEGKYTIF